MTCCLRRIREGSTNTPTGETVEVEERVVRCSDKLKRWGRRKRMRFKEEINECCREMEEFRESISEEGSRRFKEASDRHSKVLTQEEMFWKQRAKMHWLKDGDSNTKFFHMSASARNSRKKIKKLTDQNGNTVTNQDELCDVAQRYLRTCSVPISVFMNRY
jgi:sulfite reductase beta subunit-like hemoprotein